MTVPQGIKRGVNNMSLDETSHAVREFAVRSVLHEEVEHIEVWKFELQNFDESSVTQRGV